MPIFFLVYFSYAAYAVYTDHMLWVIAGACFLFVAFLLYLNAYKCVNEEIDQKFKDDLRPLEKLNRGSLDKHLG